VAVEQVLPAFLGEFHNLRVEGGGKPRLVIDNAARTLDLSQLSDGERGLLAVLIDLTRRLAQANLILSIRLRTHRPSCSSTSLTAHASPLQREIVSRLTATFPKCQFVTTTHSPKIISEVSAGKVASSAQEGDRIVPERCGQAYGLDVNYVLEHIIGNCAEGCTCHAGDTRCRRRS